MNTQKHLSYHPEDSMSGKEKLLHDQSLGSRKASENHTPLSILH